MLYTYLVQIHNTQLVHSGNLLINEKMCVQPQINRSMQEVWDAQGIFLLCLKGAVKLLDISSCTQSTYTYILLHNIVPFEKVSSVRVMSNKKC